MTLQVINVSRYVDRSGIVIASDKRNLKTISLASNPSQIRDYRIKDGLTKIVGISPTCALLCSGYLTLPFVSSFFDQPSLFEEFEGVKVKGEPGSFGEVEQQLKDIIAGKVSRAIGGMATFVLVGYDKGGRDPYMSQFIYQNQALYGPQRINLNSTPEERMYAGDTSRAVPLFEDLMLGRIVADTPLYRALAEFQQTGNLLSSDGVHLTQPLIDQFADVLSDDMRIVARALEMQPNLFPNNLVPIGGGSDAVIIEPNKQLRWHVINGQRSSKAI